VATLDEIRANNANLSIPLYVRPVAPAGGGEAAGSLRAALLAWDQSSRDLHASMERLFGVLAEAGIDG
jgi:hypothetical protein